MVQINEVTTHEQWRYAESLLWDYVSWIRDVSGLDPLHEQPPFRQEMYALEATYGAPAAALLLATVGNEAVGIVGLRHHDDGSTELKRLYVEPSARGQGVAPRLVHDVIERADQWGSEEIWLESVAGFMDTAITLYRRFGFLDIDRGHRSFDVEGMVVMRLPLRRRATG